MELVIDREFKGLCRPLNAEEKEILEESLLAEGCRDPLVVWRGILLDGHHRYDICTRHGIPYEVREIDLPGREAAWNWVINNQLGRRNLSKEETWYLRGKRYEAEKMDVGRPQKFPQNEGIISETAQRLASEYNIGHATIERDYEYAHNIDTVAEAVGKPAMEIVATVKPRRRDAKELATAVRERPSDLKEGFEGGEEILSSLKTKLRRGRSKKKDLSVHFSSASSEWNTPQHIIERVVKVLGTIDLDPCSNSKERPNVPARVHYTIEDDGLSQEWFGKVYMNPPYGDEIKLWVAYLHEQWERGNVKEAIALVPSRTDTRWFRILREFPRCFLWGRLKFSEEGNSAPFPSVVFYLGEHLKDFVKAFSDIGDTFILLEETCAQVRGEVITRAIP